VSPGQLLYANKIAQGKGLIIPDDAKTSSATMSAWIDLNRDKTRHKRGRRTAYKSAGSIAPQSTAPSKRHRQPKASSEVASLTPASVTGKGRITSLGSESQRRN
jgi:DNA topoisomerase III